MLGEYKYDEFSMILILLLHWSKAETDMGKFEHFLILEWGEVVDYSIYAAAA
jgi:hypothetical protein